MKIALLGYGKMGKTIHQLIKEEYAHRHEVSLQIHSGNAKELSVEELAKSDVAIEFSTPASVYDNILLCFEANVPVVVGTTAWQNKFADVVQTCVYKKQTLFYASNFSIGVNVFFAINHKLAQFMNRLPDYDIQIEETHHIQKLDAPSGTAITLADDILDVVVRKEDWVNHESDVKDELPIISKRLEDVKGTHKVTYQSAIDTIEIQHIAHSRKGFAQGAIMAAEWVQGKQGVFTMRDMLDL